MLSYIYAYGLYINKRYAHAEHGSARYANTLRTTTILNFLKSCRAYDLILFFTFLSLVLHSP